MELHTDIKKWKGNHSCTFSGINNLRVSLISVFKCYHSWLQNPENKGIGGAGTIIILTVNSDFFFFRFQKEQPKEKCRSSAFILWNFQKSNHKITVTGPDFQCWKKKSNRWKSNGQVFLSSPLKYIAANISFLILGIYLIDLV